VVEVLEGNTLPPAAVLVGLLAAGVLDEDAPHGLGRRGEEVTASVEAVIPDQPQVRFVDQGGSIEGVAGASRASRAAASRRSSS
jgi:hypothetical protein